MARLWPSENETIDGLSGCGESSQYARLIEAVLGARTISVLHESVFDADSTDSEFLLDDGSLLRVRIDVRWPAIAHG